MKSSWLPRLFALFLHILMVASSDGGESLVIFSSQPQRIQAKLGQDVRFPCHTAGGGSAVLTWNWNGRLVSAGNMKVYTDERIQVVSGGSELLVRGVTREDRGEFLCTVNLKQETPVLRHTLEVLVAPSIKISSKGAIKVEEGSRVEISCQAAGFPKPSVRWVRKGKLVKMKTDVVEEEGRLVLPAVNPEDAGSYACVGENSEGSSRQEVLLTVFYKPRVVIERRGGKRSGAVLACTVQANPLAQVTWHRDGVAVLRRGVAEAGGVHLLTLPSMQEKDYGNYSCTGHNKLGSGSASLLVTGSPDKPVILSLPQGQLSGSYRLEWRVWSPPQFPIMNQSILYRRTGKGTRTNAEPGSWHNLALISEGGQQQDSYSMVLTGLEEEAEYELRLRAMNRQGWSGLSEPFHFRTAGPGGYMDIKAPLSGRQLTSGGRSDLHQLHQLERFNLLLLVPFVAHLSSR